MIVGHDTRLFNSRLINSDYIMIIHKVDGAKTNTLNLAQQVNLENENIHDLNSFVV